MKRKFTEEQIISILKQQENGVPVKEIMRRHNVTEQTFYRWKSKYGGIEVSDARKKEIATELQNELNLSERHLCRLLKINRTFKRYKSVKPEQDEIILKRLGELASRWKRFGYKRLHVLLRREGFMINHKRTYRIYKAAGLYKLGNEATN